MSDGTPTQRIDAPVPEGGGTPDPEKKSRGLMIALIAIGAVILVAIIVLLIVLLSGSGKPVVVGTTTPTATVSDTPTASTTPSATPTPTRTASTPAPTQGSGGGNSQPTGAALTAFTPVTQVQCDQGGPNFTPPPIPIQVKWSTVRTNSVWIVFGGSDAADSQFMQLPVSGNQSNFPYELDYPCGAASTELTMTLVGSDGQHVQKHWTVTNTGDKF